MLLKHTHSLRREVNGVTCAAIRSMQRVNAAVAACDVRDVGIAGEASPTRQRKSRRRKKARDQHETRIQMSVREYGSAINGTVVGVADSKRYGAEKKREPDPTYDAA